MTAAFTEAFYWQTNRLIEYQLLIGCCNISDTSQQLQFLIHHIIKNLFIVSLNNKRTINQFLHLLERFNFSQPCIYPINFFMDKIKVRENLSAI